MKIFITTLLLASILMFSAAPVFSENAETGLLIEQLKTGKSEKTISLDGLDKKLEGKAKLGISLGFPTGVTFGYQLTKVLELNAVLGMFDIDEIAFGVSGLFTLADIELDDEIFPISLGPAVYLRTGNELKTVVLGVLRVEYTFEDSPVNLYIEGGSGLEVVPDVKYAGSGAIGIRYVF